MIGTAVAGRKVQFGVGQLGRVAVSDNQRAIGPALLHSRISRDMVAMPVRVQNGRRHETVVIEQFQNLLRLEAGIDTRQSLRPFSQITIRVFVERRGDNSSKLKGESFTNWPPQDFAIS